MAKRDYYETLGVEKTADEKTMKSAFRKKAMDCHPDRHPDDPEAEARFKELNEAYGILSDAQKRAAYDRMGHRAFEQGGGGAQGFQDFGSFAGKDMEIKVPIAEDCERCDGIGAEPGAKIETCQTCGGAGRVRTQQGFFTMERPCSTCGGQGEYVSNPCTTCDGQGQQRVETTLDITIPAGVEDGTRIRMSGQGDAAPRRQGGGARGDLYLFISIKPHELFERDGANLYCRAPLAMTTAALGGERGDMYVELSVETPSKLTKRQKELLQEFEAESGMGTSPESDNFLSKAKRFWDELRD